MALAFLWVSTLKVEETKADEPPSIGSSLGLLGIPSFFLAVLGIFLYVGAEAGMGRFLLPTLENMGMEKTTASTFGPTMFFFLLTIGRIAGGIVLTALSPRTFFRISALLGLLGAGALMSGVEWLAVAGVIAAGLGFANIWPLLFSITVEKKPECDQRTLRLDVHGHCRRRHRAADNGTTGRFEIRCLCLCHPRRLLCLLVDAFFEKWPASSK